MSKFVCFKCIKSSDEIITKYETCDCIITDDDYYASRPLECWCDETDWMCTDCQKISYAKYKVESEQITIQCDSCHEITKSCCLVGFYEIK